MFLNKICFEQYVAIEICFFNNLWPFKSVLSYLWPLKSVFEQYVAMEICF